MVELGEGTRPSESTYYEPGLALDALHLGEKVAQRPVVTCSSQVPKCWCWNANP